MKLKNLEEIHTELLRLTELRKQIVSANDSINRLFNPDTNAPTWDELERAKDALEGHTIPFFYVNYVDIEGMYCLVPQPKRSDDNENI